VTTAWVGGGVVDLGNEVTGEPIDLAFNPLQPRGPDGKWTRSGGGMASGIRTQFSPPPDDFMERQRATRAELVRASQQRIIAALTADPSKMSDEQIHAAAQVIERLAPHDYDQVRARTHEVVPPHIADHVDQRLAALAKDLQHEQNQDARKKLIGGLTLVLGALALSFLAAGLGVPVGIAALIGILPEIGKEYKDFLVDRKKESLIERAS
jgi:hypothetical protein